MADGTVGVKQATDADRLIDNVVLFNDVGDPVWRQKVAVGGVVSAANSVLDITLASGEEWVGTYEEITDYAEITYAHNGAPAAAPGTVQFEFSFDGTQVDVTAGALQNSGVGLSAPHTLIPVGRFLRLRYTNGATPLINFRLQTMLHSAKSKGLTRFPVQTMTDYDDVDFVRAITTGRAPTDEYVNIPVGGNDPGNSTQVLLAANAAFVGTWRRTHGYSSALVFAFGDQPLADIKVEWSDDGVNPRPGLLASSSLLTSETLTSGYYVYLLTLTTMVAPFYRLSLLNGAIGQLVFEADTWLYDDPYPGSYGGLTADLSVLSTALLTRAVLAGTDPNGAFKNAKIGGQADALSTTDLLPADEVFTSPIVSAEGYATVGVSIQSDQRSAPGGLGIKWWGDAAGTIALREMPLTYDSAPKGAFFQVPTQGPYVQIVYVNGPIGQNSFGLHVQFDVASPGPLMQSLGDPLGDRNLANTSRSVTMLRQDDGTYSTSHATANGNLSVSLDESNAEQAIKSLSSWRTRQVNVPSVAPLRIITSPLSGRRSFAIKNMGVGQVYLHQDNTVSKNNGWPLDSRESVVLELDEVSAVWAVAQDTGGLTASGRRSGTSVVNNGATNPDNVLVADSTFTTLIATGQSVEVEGYAAPGVYPAIQSVKVGFNGRKATSPTTETVVHVATVTGTQGSGTSVTSATVTADPTNFYLMSVSRKNATANILSVVGLGLTWQEIGNVAGYGDVSRTSLWKGLGTPTASGPVTVNFSENATNSVVAVSRFVGVDPITPIENGETLNSVSNTDVYSDSIVGSTNGMVVTAIGCRNRSHTPGSGFTEQAEVQTGSGNNDADLSVSTLPIAAGGTVPYSGSLSGTTGWSLVAASLRPAPAKSPTVELSYKLDGVEGPTTATLVLTSTTAADHVLDVTGDAAFEAVDIATLSVLVASTDITAVDAELDHIFIDLVEEETGVSQRIAWVEVGM